MKPFLSVAVLIFAFAPVRATAPAANDNLPQYTRDGRLKLPQNYREWVFLSSGVDMSYGPAMQMGHHMFDNVFVNPEAYKTFLQTGKWPDKTIMVLEVRKGETKGSINQAGTYQSGEIMGREVHIKDGARFPGKWAFFGFGDGDTARMVPLSASCYSCHSEHGAVDTTFVQFYPTLLPVATSKGTLASGYVKETAAATK